MIAGTIWSNDLSIVYSRFLEECAKFSPCLDLNAANIFLSSLVASLTPYLPHNTLQKKGACMKYALPNILHIFFSDAQS
jgi:hypothetical protein